MDSPEPADDSKPLWHVGMTQSDINRALTEMNQIVERAKAEAEKTVTHEHTHYVLPDRPYTLERVGDITLIKSK